MNYREIYKDYVEGGRINYDKVPPDVIKEVMQSKKTMMIFLENIDLCRETLGESPIVARMLYEIVAYDRMVDKDSYQIPDFSKYENGKMAEVVFKVMINSTKANFITYITKAMQKQYNGCGNKKRHFWEQVEDDE